MKSSLVPTARGTPRGVRMALHTGGAPSGRRIFVKIVKRLLIVAGLSVTLTAWAVPVQAAGNRTS
jgi:hypothetical protein